MEKIFDEKISVYYHLNFSYKYILKIAFVREMSSKPLGAFGR